MNMRVIVPAILASVMLGAPAMAANSQQVDYSAMTSPAGQAQQAAMKTPAERCTALESQFDTAIKSHGTSALISEAKDLRTEGGQLCASGQPIDGVGEIESALWDLGITPQT
jgi:hypothetical protein